MRKRGSSRLGISALGIALLGAAAGCSDKKSSDDSPTTPTTACSFTATAQGCVVRAASDTATVDFSTAPANSQFLVMPFILGNTATVDGSLPTAKYQFNFTIAAAAAATPASTSTTPASLRLAAAPAESPALPPRHSRPARSALMRGMSRDLDLRSLANHFDPRRGLDQEPGFWELASKVDRDAAPAANLLGALSGRPAADSVASFYRNAAESYQPPRHKETLELASDDCPSTSVVVPDGSGKTKSVTIPTGGADTTHSDFCIVYLVDPVAEPSKTKIASSIEAILTRYKTNIYKDTFPALGSYTFKPVYVVVDIGNASSTFWPTTAAYSLAGVFLGATADAASKPIIYIAADFTKIPTFSTSSASFIESQFHSVLAHETQHAILNYYRRDSTGVSGKIAAEPITIDEGLAHYMEDLFGYGIDSFGLWGLSFVQGISDDTVPFLVGAADYGAPNIKQDAARASAHVLLYYLASQKGGVSFTNGVPSGGGGLDYVVSVVKNQTSSGPTNLATTFGSDWTTTMGNYLGALELDNVAMPDAVPSQYTVEAPTAVVTNLTGGTNQYYGMRYNNFNDEGQKSWGELGDHKSDWADSSFDISKIPNLAGQSYYMTKPFTYTAADLTKQLSVQCDCGGSPTNLAVSVIRIK